MSLDCAAEITIDQIPALDGFWYLASPYSKYPGGIEAAARDICVVAGGLLRKGVPFYCPIAESHAIAIAAGIDPMSHDIWLPFDRPKMKAAAGLLVAQLPGWADSYGIGVEIDEFTAARKPVLFLRVP